MSLRVRGVPSLTLAALAAASLGCAIRLRQPTSAPHPGTEPGKLWTRVLADAVDANGRIDFAALKEDHAYLREFISHLAVLSPASDPYRFLSRESRLAFYINAYNALAMYIYVDAGRVPAQGASFFRRARVAVGGELLSLDELEERYILAEKEPRVHFALNALARGYPRLPREPYAAADMDARLDAAARAFLDDPLHVRLDAKARTVRLSRIFDRRRDVFLTAAPSLIAYVNRYRKEMIPETYKVTFLPFDWKLNEKTTEKPAAKRS